MRWYNEVLDCAHENIEIVLVGNKIDLESEYELYRMKTVGVLGGSQELCRLT